MSDKFNRSKPLIFLISQFSLIIWIRKSKNLTVAFYSVFFR